MLTSMVASIWITPEETNGADTFLFWSYNDKLCGWRALLGFCDSENFNASTDAIHF